ncbi:MAG: vWA domain-containing protein [Bacteroidota bacterium]
MKRILPKLAFIPFVLAIVFASKFMWARIWEPAPTPTEEMAAATPVAMESSQIQVALLLDVSGSMQGLLEQAKAQLWNIVNELAVAQQGGQQPDLQIALYTYGNANSYEDHSYAIQLTPFTEDLDRISEELFSLSTTGSNEYCGQVIQKSLNELAWADGEGDLRIVFIAGNEPFTQGPVNFQQACQDAKSRDIVINTIFCGEAMTGINGMWQQGALLAGGEFMSIDHNQQTVHVATPYDQQLSQLNQQLNETYIPYGNQGAVCKQRQVAEDSKAASLHSGNAAKRAISKGSRLYKNAHWDLVDACDDKAFDWEKVQTETLPDSLQQMNAAERKAAIMKAKAKRMQVQAEIKALSAQRKAYVAEQERKESGGQSLDSVMLKAVKLQAEKKAYEFK